jgi:hypothetical protein
MLAKISTAVPISAKELTPIGVINMVDVLGLVLSVNVKIAVMAQGMGARWL